MLLRPNWLDLLGTAVTIKADLCCQEIKSSAQTLWQFGVRGKVHAMDVQNTERLKLAPEQVQKVRLDITKMRERDLAMVIGFSNLAACARAADALNDDLISTVFDCRLKVGVLPAGNTPFVLPQSVNALQ